MAARSSFKSGHRDAASSLGLPSAETARSRELKEKVFPSSITVFVREKGTNGSLRAIGSGSVIEQGADYALIGTNEHVAMHAEYEFFIKTYSKVANHDELTDERKVEWKPGPAIAAEVVGPHPMWDAAVLKVRTTGLKPIEMANSNDLEENDPLWTMGTSLGIFNNALSKGVVSTTPKLWDPELDVENNFYHMHIITDADIQPGNSGGIAFDEHGRMVGITTWGISSVRGSTERSGIVPINAVKTFFAHAELYRDTRLGLMPIIISSLQDSANYHSHFKQAVQAFKATFETRYGKISQQENKTRLQALFNDPGFVSYFLMVVYGQVLTGNFGAIAECLAELEAEFKVSIGLKRLLDSALGAPEEKRSKDTINRVSGTLGIVYERNIREHLETRK